MSRSRALQAVEPVAEAGADRDQSSQEFRYAWIGPTEAMQHLGLGSQSALYRLIREWRLPHGRMGRLYRFRRADLDQWMVRRGAEALTAVQRRA